MTAIDQLFDAFFEEEVKSQADYSAKRYWQTHDTKTTLDDIYGVINSFLNLVWKTKKPYELYTDSLPPVEWRWRTFRFLMNNPAKGVGKANEEKFLELIDSDSIHITQENLPILVQSKFIEIFNEPHVQWNVSNCTQISGLFANALSFAGDLSESFEKTFAKRSDTRRKRVVGMLAGAPHASTRALLTEYRMVLTHEATRVKQWLRTARRGAMGADSRVVSSYRCFATRRRLTKTRTRTNVHCHWADPQYTTLLLGLRFLDYHEPYDANAMRNFPHEARQLVFAKMQALLDAEFLPSPNMDGGGEAAPKRPSLYRQLVGWLKHRGPVPAPVPERADSDDLSMFDASVGLEAKDTTAREQRRERLLRTFHWLVMVAVRMTINYEGRLRIGKVSPNSTGTPEEHFQRLSRAARASHGRRMYGLYLLSEFQKRLAPPPPRKDGEDGETWRKEHLLPVTDHVFHVLLEDCAHGNRDYEFVFGAFGEWDVAGVTDMSGAFKDWPVFDEDLTRWKLPNAKDMIKNVRFRREEGIETDR